MSEKESKAHSQICSLKGYLIDNKTDLLNGTELCRHFLPSFFHSHNSERGQSFFETYKKQKKCSSTIDDFVWKAGLASKVFLKSFCSNITCRPPMEFQY